MTLKLTKAQDKERDALADMLRKAKDSLESSVEAFNDVLKAAQAGLQEQVDGYNAVLQAAREFAEGLVMDWEGEAEEKSEAWQESERGEAVMEWIETWRGVEEELEDIDLDMGEEMELDLTDAEEVLLQLPSEPEF